MEPAASRPPTPNLVSQRPRARNQVLAVVAAETLARNSLHGRVELFRCSSLELAVAGEELPPRPPQSEPWATHANPGDDSGSAGAEAGRRTRRCTLPERATVLVSEVRETKEGVHKSVFTTPSRLLLKTRGDLCQNRSCPPFSFRRASCARWPTRSGGSASEPPRRRRCTPEAVARWCRRRRGWWRRRCTRTTCSPAPTRPAHGAASTFGNNETPASGTS